jgi:GTPase SAR1 family protein
MESTTSTHRVVLFGSLGSGKSTLLNAAVGHSVAPANDSTRGVTAFFEEYKSRA